MRDFSKVAARGTLILVIVAIGSMMIWLNLAAGIASVTRDNNPHIALDWFPADARAQAKMAERLLQGKPDSAELSRARALAEASLKRDPTVVPAIRNLAIAALMNSRPSRGERLMLLSEALSRRDLPTQLWLIEKEVAENDAEGALHHFDIALRTSNSAGILWPILINATAEPQLIAPMAELLSRDPPWRELFMPQLIAHGPSVINLAKLDYYLRRMNSPLPDHLTAHLIQRLDGKGEYDEMRGVYRRVRKLSAEQSPLIRNGGFETSNLFPPLDWKLTKEPGFSSMIMPEAEAKEDLALWFEARTGHGGEVATQRLLLDSGRYRLSAQAGDISSESTGLPYLQLVCDQTGAVLMKRGLDQTNISSVFSVPSSCAAQSLSLQLRSSKAPEGVSGWIDDLRIEAIR